jgi:hypothetical protein
MSYGKFHLSASVHVVPRFSLREEEDTMLDMK